MAECGRRGARSLRRQCRLPPARTRRPYRRPIAAFVPLTRSAAFLRVVLLRVDGCARVIEFVLQTTALAARHHTVGLGGALVAADVRLLRAQAGGFAPGQL